MWTPFVEVKNVNRGLPTPTDLPSGKVYENNKYIVVVRELHGPLDEGWVWLSIKHVSGEALHDWRDFQRIKNELVGPEVEAVELYPAESRLVDTSNQYHLFCLPPGYRLPVGFNERLVCEVDLQGTRQRKWKEDKPADLISETELRQRLSKLYQYVPNDDGTQRPL